MNLIDASHFLELIRHKKKLSEQVIPELLKRLIKESVFDDCFYHVPSGDDIFTPGWDGFVCGNTKNNRFVPLGDSLFEVGTKTNGYKSAKKLTEDYEKRKLDANFEGKSSFSYIAVTTMMLSSTVKADLQKNWCADGVFKKVLILDANDLAEWLNYHINIVIWLLKQYGKKLEDYDISTINDEWEKLSSCTEPALTADLFTSGNESRASSLVDTLNDAKEKQILTVSSSYYGRDFAFAFTVASLIASGNQEICDRAIVVHSQSAMSYVNSCTEGKLILVDFNCFDERFAIDLKNTYLFFDVGRDEGIKLDMVERKGFEEKVAAIFDSDKSRAFRVSFEVDYNILALRRFLAKAPSIKIPDWSRRKDKNELIPLLLLGEVKMTDAGDVDFLSALVGNDLDSYTEKMNIWSESSQSPILKYEDFYRVCSRKECFDFLQIDIFSHKMKKLEEKLSSALLTANPKVLAKNALRPVDLGGFIWRDRLFINIINGFIALSEKSKRNQKHFDSFVCNLLSGVIGKRDVAVSIAPHFSILSELSPTSFLGYVRKSLEEDKKSFKQLLTTERQGLLYNFKFAYHIIWGIEKCLELPETSQEGFDLLIKLFLEFGDIKPIADAISKYLTVVSTMTGLIAIPYINKINYFFKSVEKSNPKVVSSLVNGIYQSGNDSISHGVSPSFRTYSRNEIKVPVQEIIEAKNRAFDWLMDHQENANAKIQTLKNLVQNLHYSDFDSIKAQLKSFGEKAVNEPDSAKVEMLRVVLDQRENILRFKDWDYLKKYIPELERLADKLESSDKYLRLKGLLLDDNYPLRNPPIFEDDGHFEKEKEIRREERAEALAVLEKDYGAGIFTMLIKDSGNSSYESYAFLFDKTDNHLRDIDTMIQEKKSLGLRVYLNRVDENTLRQVLEKYGQNTFVIQCLPYKKVIFDWIDGKSLEQSYWENQFFDIREESEFDFLFSKFLEYAPHRMIGEFAYRTDLDYSHEIALLKRIVDYSNDSEKSILLKQETHAIQKLVEKMDKKYYTPELSMCEFNLLHMLRTSEENYPEGLKKHFWNHPTDLGLFLTKLFEDRKTLPENSLGKDILYSALLGIGNNSFIPDSFIIQQREKLLIWIKDFLSCSVGKENEIGKFLRSVAISVLVRCPASMGATVWPTIEVADALERLPSFEDDEHDDIASSFYCRWTNMHGMRTVENGSRESALSAEYKGYANQYRQTHPRMAKALDYISESFDYEAKADKERAVFGDE